MINLDFAQPFLNISSFSVLLHRSIVVLMHISAKKRMGGML